MMQNEKESEFKQWVYQYSDQLYAYALNRRFSEADARDLLQETFLAAWRNLDNYKREASVKNWLFLILKNKINDHFRKAVNKMEIESIHHENNEDAYFDEQGHWSRNAYPKQWPMNFNDKVEVKEFQAAVRQCGSKLKQIQNTVFALKYVEGLESDAICKHLGITASNYWVIIHRAKVQLRACLQKNWMTK